MNRFEDLKLPDGLVEHLHGLGYRHPSALQVETVAVVARGTTVMGIASAGSGKTLAYGLGLAARLDAAAPGPQALVLRPTDDGAENTADSLHSLMQGNGLDVKVVRPRSATTAHVAVGSPSAALAAIEHSAIKLDALNVLVVDGVSAMVELDASEALETLTAQMPKEAQRVILTSELNGSVEDYIDRHARRARRLAYLPAEVEPLGHVTLEYYSAPRTAWVPALSSFLEAQGAKAGEAWTIRCHHERDAEELANRLAVRGFDTRANRSHVRVKIETGDENRIEPGARSLSWGAPLDLQSFQSRVTNAARAIAFIEPREAAHLQRLASTLAVRLAALKVTHPGEAHRSAQQTRDELREATANRDLEPYVLLIEPLLDEFTPTQLAAAATALYRERVPETPAQPLPAWTRLYFAVGRRDGVRPADLVGAITGESSVSGEGIGRIEIRDNYSSVEVAASVADRVIKSLATATIRGRPAHVRVFRE
jgi:ATP-dependent RNA helicase DeaD